PIRDRVNVQLRAEAFNLFNQVNFGQPTNTLSSGLFGQPTKTLASSLGAGGVAGGGFSPLYQVGGPRSIPFALKLQFCFSAEHRAVIDFKKRSSSLTPRRG